MCALLDGEPGNIRVTHEFTKLQELLAADPDGWALIVLDPMARIAGLDVEGNNQMATVFIQVAEKLLKAPGNPTVLITAHSSKDSRRMGSADVRGVTALTDGARWVAILTREKGALKLEVIKSNYTLIPPAIRLPQGPFGTFTVESPEQAQAREDDRVRQEGEKLDRDIDKVVAAVEKLGGSASSKAAISRTAGMKATNGRAAIDTACDRGLLVPGGTTRNRSYRLRSHRDGNDHVEGE